MIVAIALLVVMPIVYMVAILAIGRVLFLFPFLGTSMNVIVVVFSIAIIVRYCCSYICKKYKIVGLKDVHIMLTQ